MILADGHREALCSTRGDLAAARIWFTWHLSGLGPNGGDSRQFTYMSLILKRYIQLWKLTFYL